MTDTNPAPTISRDQPERIKVRRDWKEISVETVVTVTYAATYTRAEIEAVLEELGTTLDEVDPQELVDALTDSDAAGATLEDRSTEIDSSAPEYSRVRVER